MKSFAELSKAMENLGKSLIQIANHLNKQLPPQTERQLIEEAESDLNNFQEKFSLKFSKIVWSTLNGGSQEILSSIKNLRQQFERSDRRRDLQAPSSDQVLNEALWWMIEKGEISELELIHQIRENTDDEKIIKLADEAISRISERVADQEIKSHTPPPQTKNYENKEVGEWYRNKPLLLKLEDLYNNLDEIRVILGEKWPSFSYTIEDAYNAISTKQEDTALEIISSIFTNYKPLDEFSERTQKHLQFGGLLSAYEQTPSIMNESLVQNKDTSRKIDLERFNEVLTDMRDDIRIINSNDI